MKLYLATSNPGKIREFTGIDVEMMPGLKALPLAPETGDTFEANAIEKALYYGAHVDGWLIAEDSGLEIDVLGGAPGVHSARWAGDDEANNQKLVREMAGQPLRTARYVCVIALVHGTTVLGTFRGTVEGEILDAPRGEGGFGYDPYFLYPPFGQTFAEIPKERKSEVSHRGAAIRLLSAWLRENASRPDTR
ncbi:RdgB/HAM1 family non-canonical purine NTP pyrophosphatase [Bryobacter aggregatus]|uniref:RdgB/HAM1 family non-canonical purine NTP pyrophosphatase n=1 Tax=Bryobacter aggregatus TaxID=360054 RepID=UPI0004E26290|nr:RdgB/HAM1 family non-canonical purine NTP pyrophosphatase [Bryobacter aggregatus]